MAGIQIRDKNRLTIDGIRIIHAVARKSSRIHVRSAQKSKNTRSCQIEVCHIRCDARCSLIHYLQHTEWIGLHLRKGCLDDFFLTIYAVPVGIADISHPGVAECLLRRQRIDSFHESPRFVHLGVVHTGAQALIRVHVGRLVIGQIYVKIPHRGYGFQETVKIYNRVPVNIYAEVLLNRLIKSFQPSCGIGGIQLCGIICAGNGHIGVTHQRDQSDLPRFCIKAADDHGI